MRKLDVCDMEESFLESSEKTIAILGDRWPQTAKQEGDRISSPFLCGIWKKRIEHPIVGGVSIRSRNGAPSRKGRVVNGQMTKPTNNKYAPPPPAVPTHPPFYPLPLTCISNNAPPSWHIDPLNSCSRGGRPLTARA